MITQVQDGNVFVEQSGHSKSHRSFTTLAQWAVSQHSSIFCSLRALDKMQRTSALITLQHPMHKLICAHREPRCVDTVSGDMATGHETCCQWSAIRLRPQGRLTTHKLSPTSSTYKSPLNQPARSLPSHTTKPMRTGRLKDKQTKNVKLIRCPPNPSPAVDWALKSKTENSTMDE